MDTITTDYPDVPWEPGWRINSAPQDSVRFETANERGALNVPGSEWALQIADPTRSKTIRMFHNGLSITGRKPKEQLTLFAIDDGVLTGRLQHMQPPTLSGATAAPAAPEQSWCSTPHNHTLLLCRKDRFALVTGCSAEAPALARAEEALSEDMDALLQAETNRRRPVSALFSINSRHNPPVAMAAETLHQRLRGPIGGLHSLWSISDGFEHETFALNDLYPLVSAWTLIDPDIALQLMQTALSLQQPTGSFPAWVNNRGESGTIAPWPLIVQSFETVWEPRRDPAILKKHLPSLRKYIRWALRYFDPHRDCVPTWQSELEIFVPNSFERGKATPDLSVMLLAEIEALQRLCRQSEHTESAADLLSEDADTLHQTLKTIFWNPEQKAFSNVWKDGHVLHEPSFASFTPLLIPDLPDSFRKPLLEHFNDTHSFPGQTKGASWKREPIGDTAHFPAIHQFITFEALRRAGSERAMISLFVHRVREGVAAWIEREQIETVRQEQQPRHADRHILSLGPVTAALILSVQNEFQQEAGQAPSVRKTTLRLIDKLKIRPTDLYIVLGTGVAILFAHMLYNLTVPENIDADMAEAALLYKQGRPMDALKICRQHPDEPLSNFVEANLQMFAGNSTDAEQLYLNVLKVNLESPSALFGYALALQMNGHFELAIRRYNDFIDIHEPLLSRDGQTDLVDYAYVFLRIAEEGFKKPPKWKQVYALPEMSGLGL